MKKFNAENIVYFKLLETEKQLLGPTFITSSIKRFDFVEFR